MTRPQIPSEAWPPTPGPEPPSPLQLAAGPPADLRESMKIMFRGVCNLMQGADAIMIDIIR